MKIPFSPKPAAKLAAAAILAGALAGCYVVPIQPAPAPAAVALVPAAAPPLTFTARLYPANELASGYGVVAATVTNDLDGRGRFSTVIGEESFTGEATRLAGSARDGLANGAGSRGGFITCRYTMNSPTLGTGTCRHSSGATFAMHIGG
ncbi:MAG: hypothetical protein KGL68_10740 [Burkholderiales bacterium]|nr:hypothetical protein [Burkholderiales bacterium]